MKQTAADWLVEQLKSTKKKHMGYKNLGVDYKEIIEQALEMEKEQIIEAWYNGWHEHMNPPDSYITSVMYYNETFKSE